MRFLVLLALAVQAKVLEANIETNSEYLFLDKFCFEVGTGTLLWSINASPPSSNMFLVIYDDESDSWPALLKNKSATCEQKTESISKGGYAKGRFLVRPNNGIENVSFSDGSRPRFWYFALSNCGSNKTTVYSMDIYFEWTNPGGKMQEQFSSDIIGIYQLFISMFVFFLIVVAFHSYNCYQLFRVDSYHPLVRLLSIIVLGLFITVFFYLIHYGIYSSNGIGQPGLAGLAELIDLSTQIAGVLLLVLLAYGWTVTRPEIPHRRVIIVGLAVLVVAAVVLFIWDNVGENPASSTYIYDTGPGIFLLIARAISWGWFLFGIRTTLLERVSPEKRKFFITLAIGGSVWFLSLVVIVIIAAFTAPWVRAKTVTCIYWIVNLISVSAMVWFLRASNTVSHFRIGPVNDMLLEAVKPGQTPIEAL